MTWDELKAMHAGVSHDAVDPDEYAAAMHNEFPAIVEWVEAMRAALAQAGIVLEVLHSTEIGGIALCKPVQDQIVLAVPMVRAALADKPLTEDRQP